MRERTILLGAGRAVNSPQELLDDSLTHPLSQVSPVSRGNHNDSHFELRSISGPPRELHKRARGGRISRAG